jgi:hypothetical protein
MALLVPGVQLDKVNHAGETALCIAGEKGHTEMVRMLVGAGAGAAARAVAMTGAGAAARARATAGLREYEATPGFRPGPRESDTVPRV